MPRDSNDPLQTPHTAQEEDKRKFKKKVTEDSTVLLLPMKSSNRNTRHQNDTLDNQSRLTGFISTQSRRQTPKERDPNDKQRDPNDKQRDPNKKQRGPNNKSEVPQSAEHRVKELEVKVNKSNDVISKLTEEKEMQKAKYNQQFFQHRKYQERSKSILTKVLLDAAQLTRKQRSQIDPALGYFTNNLKNFVEGETFLNLRQQIQTKKALIQQASVENKITTPQTKEKNIFIIDFHSKMILELERELHAKEKYVFAYKEKLKLAEREQESQYYREGWPLLFHRYQTLELLGSGECAEVYKCFDLQSNQEVALKVTTLDKDSNKYQEEIMRHVKREVETQKQLKHPNIAQMLDLLECESNRVSFTLDWCSGPDLAAYLRKYCVLEEKESKSIIKQVFNALGYLQGLPSKVIHYDLKPSNIIFHHGVIKLLDFGLCKRMEGEDSRMKLSSQGVGTCWYLPPETFDPYDAKISSKVDVWSAGVIFFELLFGKKPFANGVPMEKVYSQGLILRATKVEFPQQASRKHRVSEGAKDFIRSCLQYDHANRISPRQALQHPYFNK